MNQWFVDNDKKVALRELARDPTAHVADPTAQEHVAHAPQLVDKAGWPGLRRRSNMDLDEIIRGDNAASVTAHIDEATMPKWANVQSLEQHFSVQATLRRYEWHLLASDKIWDISRAAMETLLILNMHLKRSAANTIRNVGLYHHLRKESRMPPHLQGRLEAQDQRTLRAQKMPREWILAQLRFNLQNPYRGTMYDKASLT